MKKLLLCLILLAIHISAAANEVPDNIIEKLTSQIPELSQYDAVIESKGELYDISFRSQTKGFAQAVVNQEGMLISYSMNVPNSKKDKRLPKVTKTLASETAIAFAQNLASDIFDQLNTKVFTNTYNSTSMAGYNVRFTRSIYGIAYSKDSVSIWVDAQTGIVTRYNRIWNKQLQIAPVDEILTQKQAEESFENNIALRLRYNKRIENGRVMPYLVYVPTNTGAIDAITGDVINDKSTVTSNGYKEMIALYENTAIAASIDTAKQEGLAAGREAQKYARKIPELKIDDDYTAEQAKYYKNTNDEYLMTIKFTKKSYTTNVTLDAKTLRIIGFYSNESEQRQSIYSVNKNEVRAVTDKFLKNYMGEYVKELSEPQISIIENAENNTCIVLYERMVNGILYKNNNAQFLVNSSGDIISMSFIWDKVEFEDSANILTIKQAYDVFFKNVGLQLMYICTPGNIARPVYTVNPQAPAIISAKTGTLLSYDGKPAKPKKSLSYIGLEGHYAQEQATVLASCDIFVSEGNVILDDNILQKDYIVLLAAISPDGMPIYEKNGGITDEELDMIYNDFVTKGVLDLSEADPDSYVMREDAVKFMLRVVGYKNVAELEGIFKMPFKDSNKILPELYGYVALARGLNLISGSEGYFYPTKNLSNADALVMIYNYLNRGELNGRL